MKEWKRQKPPEPLRDEEGRAVINLSIRDDEGFLSPYSRDCADTISEETAEFLRNSALSFHPKEQLALHIYSDCVDEKEQEAYPRAIKSYFQSHLLDAERELRRNAVVSLIMFLVGLSALVVMFLGEFLGWNQIWIECIDIFAWVFIWETVDLFFLERASLRRKRKRCLAFREIKVLFFPPQRKA